jgi:hypothetical protein
MTLVTGDCVAVPPQQQSSNSAGTPAQLPLVAAADQQPHQPSFFFLSSPLVNRSKKS